MNIRRILFIALMAFIVLFAYKSIQDDALTGIQVPGKISIDEVLESFNSGLIECEGEEKNLSALYFSNNYVGKDGEVFYVLVQSEDEPITTCKYRIEETVDDSGTVSMGFNMEESWDGVELPVNKFNVYRLINSSWENNISS